MTDDRQESGRPAQGLKIHTENLPGCLWAPVAYLARRLFMSLGLVVAVVILLFVAGMLYRLTAYVWHLL